MNNSNTYRIIAFSLAILMFSTSVGFAIDMHYCGDHLKSVNFFGKAKDCLELANPKAEKKCSHPHHQEEKTQNKAHSLDKKDCCNNKVIQFQADQDQELQIVDYSISQPLQQFVVALVFTFFNPSPIERKKPSFALYKPPLLLRDIPVLVQSFRL
ncbi:HYC_CC_PP family protein [Flavilitoribacter nigricans]|uniref:Secreted protein n=1 Tax=Flavilitoribacter nigricans (strain ATCC 23147 / DSM 23189 / NBRC 102662 / NCIMB 1420 / SS-2) TaxID=1122177 RepID=A0A2D0N0H8_FLAN2|nr:hypothetical protein [Flavilitoribacter nigricans]PHN01878.1 hypothetical protein CRP01_35165 [Flavilitoribacter nigricans DSM 23189 = NBRC 102662]